MLNTKNVAFLCREYAACDTQIGLKCSSEVMIMLLLTRLVVEFL